MGRLHASTTCRYWTGLVMAIGDTLDHMTENGWQAIGRIAKSRRERLGLNQDELAQYGGPKVSTVGKFERAVATFPLRTQHQLEKALGWSRGVIEQFVAAHDEDGLDMADWEHDLIEEDIPDLSSPDPDLEFRSAAAAEHLARARLDEFRARTGEGATIDDLIQESERAIRLLKFQLVREEAGLAELLRQRDMVGGDGDAEEPRSSAPTRADYERAADEDAHTIESEQGHDENA